MRYLTQTPHDRDVDDFLSDVERDLCTNGSAREQWLLRNSFASLRRCLEKQRRQLRDRDCEILDLQDELSAAECRAHDIPTLEAVASWGLSDSVEINNTKTRKK